MNMVHRGVCVCACVCEQRGSVSSSSSAVHAVRDIAGGRICNGMRRDVLPQRRDATPLFVSS